MSSALLAFELSGPTSTVAIRVGAHIHERDFSAQRGRMLIPEMDALLAEHSVARQDLRAVLCGIGPGSYTGLRIAAAAARALSFALQIPCAGVPSLQAAALQAAPGERLHLILDAFRNEVYHAAFQREVDRVIECVAPQVLARADVAAALGADPLLLGDPALLGDAPPPHRLLADHVTPRAGGLLEVAAMLGLQSDGSGIEALPEAAPLYLRPAAYPPNR